MSVEFSYYTGIPSKMDSLPLMKKET